MNLVEETKGCRDAFLKLDIEGHDGCFLPSSGKERKRVKQLVIEIHSPGDIVLFPSWFAGLQDVTHDVMFSQLEILNETHTLVHVHPNNVCKTHVYDGFGCPMSLSARTSGTITHKHQQLGTINRSRLRSTCPTYRGSQSKRTPATPSNPTRWTRTIATQSSSSPTVTGRNTVPFCPAHEGRVPASKHEALLLGGPSVR